MRRSSIIDIRQRVPGFSFVTRYPTELHWMSLFASSYPKCRPFHKIPHERAPTNYFSFLDQYMRFVLLPLSQPWEFSQTRSFQDHRMTCQQLLTDISDTLNLRGLVAGAVPSLSYLHPFLAFKLLNSELVYSLESRRLKIKCLM
jgi:hypothetical protein